MPAPIVSVVVKRSLLRSLTFHPLVFEEKLSESRTGQLSHGCAPLAEETGVGMGVPVATAVAARVGGLVTVGEFSVVAELTALGEAPNTDVPNNAATGVDVACPKEVVLPDMNKPAPTAPTIMMHKHTNRRAIMIAMSSPRLLFGAEAAGAGAGLGIVDTGILLQEY